jgi:hypothetical protein
MGLPSNLEARCPHLGQEVRNEGLQKSGERAEPFTRTVGLSKAEAKDKAERREISRRP